MLRRTVRCERETASLQAVNRIRSSVPRILFLIPELNYGGPSRQLALVKANQLMPKPAHLSWEEAACPGLVNSTAYRQLVSHHGAQMKQGDTVLIWGASGGLGSYAVQYALNGGAIPVCVVS